MFVKVIDSTIIEYPYSIDRLRVEYPNVSFPNNIAIDHASLADFNVFRVFQSIEPNYDSSFQKLEEAAPIKREDGNWYQAWNVISLDEDELKLNIQVKSAEVRSKRDNLLLESDPLVMIDRWETYSQTKKDAIASYRQALRDITAQEGFPFDVQFPSLVLPE